MLRAAAVPAVLAAVPTTAASVPYILASGQSAIPFIHLSSGSVAAGGGISAITALRITYANAYCWFPANSLSASHAAGWFYCTFSSTTAGTAFLNGYTSGAPAIPSSPTAVSAGQGAFTSDTAEHAGPTISLAANSLGINGKLRIESMWEATNSAGNKTGILRYTGSGGTQFLAGLITTNINSRAFNVIANRGATNIQNGFATITFGSSSLTNPNYILGAIDTTAATSIVLALSKSAATDNLVLEGYSIEVMASA